MHSFSWRIRRPLRGRSKTDSGEKSETVVLERSVISNCTQAREDDDGVAELSDSAKLAESSITIETSAQLEGALRDALTMLDDRLVEVLSEGAIRLVRSSWLLQQPAGFHLPHRQQLELLEGALLSAEEAVALVMRGNRSVAVLSHGWLSPGDPDPMGERVKMVCRALSEHQSLAAIFWDYASLYQHPPGGRRSGEEEAAFSRALSVMGDLYASAVGTTILQIKEIPPRPAEFDGRLCLLNCLLAENAIRDELRHFGVVQSCMLDGGGRTVVQFSTHEMAEAAARGAPSLGLCSAAFLQYNERSYDGRRGEDGRDDDDGRGCGMAVLGPSAALLTGLPASGKTTLVSQAVMIAAESPGLVPIVVKVQRLEAQMRQAPGVFSSAINWVDPSVGLEYGVGSPLHRMLQQAMASRRVLLLIDGLDEGGANRDAIERHVVDVLAPQGHLILATSRPAGIDYGRFADFVLVKLAPLSRAQQLKALESRLGSCAMQRLLPFLDQMPTDTETSQPVTSNPLMLAMVASVFELRQGVGMPASRAELYAIASEAMLKRGRAMSNELRRLLKAVVCEAHVAGWRVIEDQHLLSAALDLESNTFDSPSDVLLSMEWTSSLLADMRARVARDELPLLTLLQSAPFELQSSHLSFQEFYTARALRDDPSLQLARELPWKWTAWWANVLSFGEEMGESFAQGLLRASGIEGVRLHLKGSCSSTSLALGGCGLQAVTVLMSALAHLSLRHNSINQACAAVLGKALKTNCVLTTLDLSYNELGNTGTAAIADALRVNDTLNDLNLKHNRIGDEGGNALAKALEVNRRLEVLNLQSNSIGDEGVTALAKALRSNSVLLHLALDGSYVDPRGAADLASAVTDSGVPARLVDIGDRKGGV